MNRTPIYYVVASVQRGTILEMRIVAGPLMRDAAEEQARLRLRGRPDIKFSIVEFDATFAMPV